MGGERQYDGVRPSSATSIEIDFYYAGKRCKERVKLPPTPANLKRAAQHRAAILNEIEAGTFDYAVVFPASKNAKKFSKTPESLGLSVESYLLQWVEDKKPQLKASTWDDYRKIVNNPLIKNLGNIELLKLNRSILDQGWFEFRRQLEYKSAWNGGFVVAVPPQYTSQTCPCCGHVSKDNRQTQARFECVECGFEENADLVGAINILARGHRVLACGEKAQSGRSVKQEPAEATQAIAA